MAKNNKKLISNIIKLWPFVSKNKKNQFYLYAFLTCISGLADLVSIGAVVPFILVFIEPENLQNINIINGLFETLNLIDKDEIQLFLCIIFSAAIFLTSTIKISLAWFQSRLSYGIAADLANIIFNYSLHRDYEYHLNTNTNNIVSTISNKANIVADNIIHPILSYLSAFVTFVAIGSFLFFVSPLISFLIFFLIGGSYISLILLVKKTISIASMEVSKNFDNVMRIVKEGLEGIRYVSLTNSQNLFVKEHGFSEKKLRIGQANISFASIFPRAVIEFVALLVFAWIIFFYFDDTRSDTINLMAIMGAIVMSVQKLLPVAQQAYFGWTKLAGAKDIINDTLDYLEIPQNLLADENKSNLDILNFQESISLQNLSFSYARSFNNSVINNLSLEIRKSSKIGITGPSGSGKSTLLDLIIGFLRPVSGKIFIDGKELKTDVDINRWQLNISLVPQVVYLSDSSIISNIAFGVKENDIDIEKVKRILKITNLEAFVESREDKFYFRVGEGGKNLSQGQRQRIGIARALYRESDLLIVDEGTSALDLKTQSEIINQLNSLKNRPAIIMVAHRMEILDGYDEIYEFNNGSLKKILG